MGAPWRRDEDEQLEELPRVGARELSRRLGRTFYATVARARALGIYSRGRYSQGVNVTEEVKEDEGCVRAWNADFARWARIEGRSNRGRVPR